MADQIDLDRWEYDLEFDLGELGEDQSECGWPERVAALLTEVRQLRALVAEVLDAHVRVQPGETDEVDRLTAELHMANLSCAGYRKERNEADQRTDAAEAALATARAEALELTDALAAAEAKQDRAENQVRHWKEQEAKQRRLHHEQGDWKHRALAAELNAIHGRDALATARADAWTKGWEDALCLQPKVNPYTAAGIRAAEGGTPDVR